MSHRALRLESAMMKPILLLTLLTAASIAVAAPSASKHAPDVPSGGGKASIEVIVQYKTPPTKDELKQLGPYGQIKKQFTAINAVWAVVTLDDIATIEKDPNVVYISPNRKLKGSLDITTQTV